MKEKKEETSNAFDDFLKKYEGTTVSEPTTQEAPVELPAVEEKEEELKYVKLPDDILKQLYQTDSLDEKMHEPLEIIEYINNIRGPINKYPYYVSLSNANNEQCIVAVWVDIFRNENYWFSHSMAVIPFGKQEFKIYRVYDAEKERKVVILLHHTDKEKHNYDLIELLDGRIVNKIEGYDDVIPYHLMNTKYIVGETAYDVPVYNGSVTHYKGYKVKKDGKIGRINPENSIFDIPVEFDDLSLVDLPSQEDYKFNYYTHFGLADSTEPLVIVKKNGLWGCYCYLEDKNSLGKNDSNNTQKTNKTYLRKVIQPVFDSIEGLLVDGERQRIYLKVHRNGKVGVLEVFSNRFVPPMLFDKIDEWKIVKEDFNLKYSPIPISHIFGRGKIGNEKYLFIDDNLLVDKIIELDDQKTLKKCHSMSNRQE